MNQFFNLILFVFPVLWLVVLIKKLFFWTWLWQLKEYHSGRFLAHFQTYKGKKIIINYLSAIKLVLILGAIFAPVYFFPIILVIYFAEAGLVILRILKRSFKYPIFTPKTILILGTGILLILGVFLIGRGLASDRFIIFFLFFDLLAPLIFSILVFCFWPVTFIWQKRLINKAIKKREQFKDLIVIGVTGSYGKSSTKEFLAQILAEKYNVLKTKANQNSEVGISQRILNDLKPEHEIFVCEMGAYNKGGIKLLCDIAQPKIGILTGINEQHMATFGSQENIISAKLELIRSLQKDGAVILNESDPKVKSEKFKVKSYSSKLKIIGCSARQQIEDLEIRKKSLVFKIGRVEFNLNLVGAHNISNVLMAIYCAKELGMPLEEISRACEKIKPLAKTMELKKGIGETIIIDDTYSANPAGVFAALDYLKFYSGKKIIIMPCLIELGWAGKRVHKQIGEKIGKICNLAIITTKDYFKETKQGALSAGMKEQGILFLESPQKIFEHIKPYLKPENVILLESRVPKTLIDLSTGT